MTTSVADFEQPSVLSTSKQHVWGLSHAKKLMAYHISCVALHYLQWSSVSASHPYFEELRENYIRQWICIILVCLVSIKSSCFSRTVFYQPESLAGFKIKLYLSSPLVGSLQMIRLITNGFTRFGMNSYTFSYCQHGCRIPENCQFNSKPFRIGLKNICLAPFFVGICLGLASHRLPAVFDPTLNKQNDIQRDKSKGY